jgi:hypothetical protein
LTGIAGGVCATLASEAAVGALAGFIPCVDNVCAQAASDGSSTAIIPLTTRRLARTVKQEA